MFGDLFAPSLEYPVLEGLIMTKNRVQFQKHELQLNAYKVGAHKGRYGKSAAPLLCLALHQN